MMENNANWVQKKTEKKTFLNAADILNAGGDEKQVFLVALASIFHYLYIFYHESHFVDYLQTESSMT